MGAFWLTASELPAGSGFALFGPAHWAWLLALLAGTVLVCRFGRGHGRLLARLLACALPATELAKDIFLWQKGQFWAGSLPFYLCGFAMFLILLDAFWPYPFLLDVLYGLCLPGTIGALLFPDWTPQPPFNLLSTQSFVFHGLLAAYIVFQLARGRRPHPVRGAGSCVLFLLGFAPLTKLLDHFWGTNFLFLEAPPAGSPLEWLQMTFGGGYLFGYALFALLLIEIMYFPLQLALWKARRGKAE
ncbi:MAG: YwaF family protein [Faecalibacterium sp.]|jgi:hypothetical integral membrane protein (TIGR02206 family)|nr:YwaF family protein [Faecalibacterium sp.]